MLRSWTGRMQARVFNGGSDDLQRIAEPCLSSQAAHMIRHFRHKETQAFFEHGSKARMQPHHAPRLASA
jgi:hypothetical protein